MLLLKYAVHDIPVTLKDMTRDEEAILFSSLFYATHDPIHHSSTHKPVKLR